MFIQYNSILAMYFLQIIMKGGDKSHYLSLNDQSYHTYEQSYEFQAILCKYFLLHFGDKVLKHHDYCGLGFFF